MCTAGARYTAAATKPLSGFWSVTSFPMEVKNHSDLKETEEVPGLPWALHHMPLKLQTSRRERNHSSQVPTDARHPRRTSETSSQNQEPSSEYECVIEVAICEITLAYMLGKGDHTVF